MAFPYDGPYGTGQRSQNVAYGSTPYTNVGFRPLPKNPIGNPIFPSVDASTGQQQQQSQPTAHQSNLMDTGPDDDDTPNVPLPDAQLNEQGNVVTQGLRQRTPENPYGTNTSGNQAITNALFGEGGIGEGIPDVNLGPLGSAQNLGVNQALDTIGNVGVPGLGIASTLLNPSVVTPDWGAQGAQFEGATFNTGGGGAIGAVGNLQRENLENIYGQTDFNQNFGEGDYGFNVNPSGQAYGYSPGLGGFGRTYSGPNELRGFGVNAPTQIGTAQDAIDYTNRANEAIAAGQVYDSASGNTYLGDTATNKESADSLARARGYASAVTDTSGRAVTAGGDPTNVVTGTQRVGEDIQEANRGPGTSWAEINNAQDTVRSVTTPSYVQEAHEDDSGGGK